MRTFDCGEGEGIVIDGRIFIELVEISGDEVCVKIDLPDDMEIVQRAELDTVS